MMRRLSSAGCVKGLICPAPGRMARFALGNAAANRSTTARVGARVLLPAIRSVGAVIPA